MNLDHFVDGQEVLETATDIITAYVGRNKVSVDDMCQTIGDIYKTLHGLSSQNRPLTYKELLNGGQGDINV